MRNRADYATLLSFPWRSVLEVMGFGPPFQGFFLRISQYPGLRPGLVSGRRFAADQKQKYALTGRTNHSLEAPGKSFVGFAAKGWTDCLEVIEHRPEQVFGHLGRADLVGVREGISRGRGGAADGAQLTLVQAQYIADVVEPGGVRQLRVEQRDDVAPRREGPRLFIHAVLARQLRDEVAGNKFQTCFNVLNFERAGFVRMFSSLRLSRSGFVRRM